LTSGRTTPSLPTTSRPLSRRRASGAWSSSGCTRPADGRRATTLFCARPPPPHPSAAFVDWDALVDANPGVLGPDGVQQGAAGRALLANAVAAAARKR
jgi:hypothetical protein